MSTIQSELNQEDANWRNSPPPTSFSAPPSSVHSSMSPLFLVVVVVVAVIFFIGGLVHLVLRFFIKRSSSPLFQSSNRHPESSSSRNLRRQLQHLFHLHDLGLDQAVIDSLPVFCCKDIVGSDEQFDCAICLCEFSEQDKLRLLPNCGHAFHMDCIDTWLLSNSTCPLCRGTLLGSGLVLENPVLNFDDSRAMSSRFDGDGDNGGLSGRRVLALEEAGVEKRVFSVRLGKFRSSTNEGVGETSRCNLDARRCYSMGTYQYVVGDSNLQVVLSHDCGGGTDTKLDIDDEHFEVGGNLEGKKINGCHKGESFSVSKIWLWSKKNKFPGSLNTHTGMPSFTVTSPIYGGT
ncbi:RING-H2 finger protein ATL46-like isoform X1 [Rosa rugosa]|uniref:RING-H2 finger protein ATL46-like isoform X1 n=2 Tax=Rosa rugosa TaxID=74645 RepID=UPI002B40D3A8|nr:RING-H2 finger protein ATL46-like isoform X1 [Rosa rugosa]